MKPEYIEGKQATENFEEGMKVLFKVPKEKAAMAAGCPTSRAFRDVGCCGRIHFCNLALDSFSSQIHHKFSMIKIH